MFASVCRAGKNVSEQCSTVPKDTQQVRRVGWTGKAGSFNSRSQAPVLFPFFFQGSLILKSNQEKHETDIVYGLPLRLSW